MVGTVAGDKDAFDAGEATVGLRPDDEAILHRHLAFKDCGIGNMADGQEDTGALDRAHRIAPDIAQADAGDLAGFDPENLLDHGMPDEFQFRGFGGAVLHHF